MKIPVNGLISLVTGSAGSLGSRVRQKLSLNGSKILAVDINHRTIVEEDTELKGKVSFITGDVSDQQFLQRVFNTYPKCDAVVNCAATYKPYYYLTSYLVAKNALESMRRNDINKGGVRGCIINVNVFQDKYTPEYFEEQERYAKWLNEDMSTLDDRVMELAQQLTDERIRCNTILVPKSTDEMDFAQIVLSILEEQQIAGKIINMEDDFRPYLGTLNEIRQEYLFAPKSLSNEQLAIEEKRIHDSLKKEEETQNLFPVKKLK